MKKKLLISLAYLALIILVLGTIMSSVKTDKMYHFKDKASLMEFDFGENCAVLDDFLAEKFNDKLYLPQDIAGKTGEEKADFENYITYRFTVPVSEGVNYGISCKKSDYAINVYVDGVLLTSTGNVSEKKEEFVPTAAAYEAFFTGKKDTAEIVLQQANYNHHKHYPIWLRLGPAEQISNYNRKVLFESVAVAIILVTAGLMNIGLFMCFLSRKELLWFSLVCFFAAIRTTFPAVTGFLVPNINWYVSHKLEICSLIAVFFFSVMYVGVLFKTYINRRLYKFAQTITGIIFALFAFAPSSIYSRCNEVCLIIMIVTAFPMLVSMLVKLIKWRKTIPQSNILALVGVAVYGLVSLNDAVGYGNYLKNLDIINTTTGVAVFAFFNSLALALEFRSSMDMLKESEAREQELDRTNKALLRLDRVRETFLSDLSHELKTPLTVIASNAAVSARQVALNRTDASTEERLGNIEREAVRLGKMVEKLKNSAEGQFREKAENINISEMLRSSADFCMPLCARNGNTVSVKCAENITAYASKNTMFHCLYNLISNATKHCTNEVIEIGCIDTEDGVVVSVVDHGEGMSKETMEHAFERGYSNDLSTGIGLPLCRELIENEGGTIFLSDTPGGGLTVNFILRKAYKDGKDINDRG